LIARALVAFLVALLVGACFGVAPAGAAPVDDTDSAPGNSAVAVNTHDGHSVFKLAFDVRTITDSTVAPENAAVAYASCTDCQTVAIAVQVVFVVGSPDVFTPQNAAVAVNDQCNMCDTLATAYQFVVQVPQPVRFTTDGRRRLNDIEKALRDLEHSGLTGVEIQAKVDDLMTQLADVLATGTEPIPQHGDDDEHDSSSSSASSSPESSSTTSPSTSSSGSTTTTSTSIAGSDGTTTTTTSTTTTSS
jgi:putative peptide zinc metalloprotease protein